MSPASLSSGADLAFLLWSTCQTAQLRPRTWAIGSQCNVQEWFQRTQFERERTRPPKFSSAFIMLFSTLFSFHLRLIIYPQLISLMLIVLLLPTTNCFSLSASFHPPRFKHDHTPWELTGQPVTSPSRPCALVDGEVCPMVLSLSPPLTETLSLRSSVIFALPSL